MFVKSIMKPTYKCFTAKKDDRLEGILQMLNEHDIQGVPVLDGDRFLGMLSRQSIYQGYFESNEDKDSYLQTTTAGDIAANKELTITEDEVFEKTLTAFKGFPVLAVVDDNDTFKGLVTRFDVLEQFESAFGVKKKGVRIAFTSEESEGRIERLGDIIRSHHENVISLATFDETDKLARRIVLKIDKKDNIDKFVDKLEKHGFRVLDVKEV
ncbi:CBS domain-containing protein [Thalassobacillus hwangdonensis]|uniref:CBS domain-containing protein n=1 Tax=Thalassobacillus hwangdonensis TaxID=546108 RepID=A0ABW3L1S1_9BACI